MKKFTSLLFLLVFLASCGGEAVTPVDTPATEIEAGINQTNEEIEAEIEMFEDNLESEGVEVTEDNLEEDVAPEDNSEDVSVGEDTAQVMQAQVSYNNPKQAVTANIEYSLDNEGKIASINIGDSNYDITKHLSDWNLDVLIGKSLDEVEDTYIAGGSLTVPAVKKALAENA